MGDFFEEKKNNLKQFRSAIDEFVKKSPLIQKQNQFDQSTLISLLSNSKSEILDGNNKISLNKLYQNLRKQDMGYLLSYSDFQNIFGLKNQMRVCDLVNVLKKYQLDSFSLKQEMIKGYFQDKKFKFPKFDHMMKQMGYQQLNKKNKQIISECFDFNGDQIIDEQDLNILQQILNQRKNNRN